MYIHMYIYILFKINIIHSYIYTHYIKHIYIYQENIVHITYTYNIDNIYIYVHIHTYVYVYMYICIYVYMYICIYIYICMCMSVVGVQERRQQRLARDGKQCDNVSVGNRTNGAKIASFLGVFCYCRPRDFFQKLRVARF